MTKYSSVTIPCFYCGAGLSVMMMDPNSKLIGTLKEEKNPVTGTDYTLFTGDYTPCSKCATRFKNGVLMMAALLEGPTGYPKFGGAFPTGVWSLLARDNAFVKQAYRSKMVVKPFKREPKLEVVLVDPKLINTLIETADPSILERKGG